MFVQVSTLECRGIMNVLPDSYFIMGGQDAVYGVGEEIRCL
jgi:hypothetical protein